MALKKIDQKPKITDTILFDILTPGADGCFTANPYKVDKITIFYLERDFIITKIGEYDKKIIDSKLEAELLDATKKVCANPSTENVQKVSEIKSKIDQSTKVYKYYYKEASPVKVFGTAGFPAWLSTDVDNALIVNVPYDQDGNLQFGHFQLQWEPKGSAREGDYVICWTWTPFPAGESLTQHLAFSIDGDASAVVTLPTHKTPRKKYPILLERYLPEMYKLRLGTEDLTPEVMYKLNLAISDGFTLIEDLANQLIDLYDANSVHESLLVYLANIFNLKLRSEDPTLWRKQIKQALPVFKKKGTLIGLKEALAQAGVLLNKMVRLWQIRPTYIYFHSDVVVDNHPFNGDLNLIFKMPTNVIWPADNPDNFQLWIRYHDTETYVPLTSNYVNFYVEDSVTYMEWLGDSLSVDSISLNTGDVLLVKYEQTVVPGVTEQSIEEYILTLPLMDIRDETTQQYPLKNWNVRLLEEDDPLFDLLIPVRHPFVNPLIFGKVRTEFPYSENVYNMEEYNGSTRDSTNPCDIDKDFIDSCGQCLSSKINLYIEIENISTQRIKEVNEIISEYLPFHTKVNTINYSGQINEFFYTPIERIDCLIQNHTSDYIMPGEANPIFNRIMGDELTGNWLTRSELADVNEVVSDTLGIGYNDRIAFTAPNLLLDDYGVDNLDNVLEVFSPSPNAGIYSINNVRANQADVTSTVIEPLNEELFTFRLMNVIYTTSTASITQDDVFKLKFSTLKLEDYFYNIKTQWDVDNDSSYSGGPWKVLISAYSATPYDIANYNPNTQELIIKNSLVDPLPTTLTTGLTVELLDDMSVSIVTESSATLSVSRRARVNINDSLIPNVQKDFLNFEDVMFYSGGEYPIEGFSEDNLQEFYVSNYSIGDVGSAAISLRRILINGQAGQFSYKGIKLQTLVNHEVQLGIVNGVNGTSSSTWIQNNKFKENFLVKINSDYYKINDIDGIDITLGGVNKDWTTLVNGGTELVYSIIQVSKKPVTIDTTTFNQIDRTGNELIEREIEYMTAFMALGVKSNDNSFRERVSAEENISFKIEYRDGDIEEGNL